MMYDNELKHYGVKGMKLGVRRSIGVRSRAAAVYKSLSKTENRNIKRLEKRKEKRGGLTDRETKLLKNSKKALKEFANKRDVLLKDIREEDIRRGERAFKTHFLFGGLGNAVLTTIDLARGEREFQRLMNKNR